MSQSAGETFARARELYGVVFNGQIVNDDLRVDEAETAALRKQLKEAPPTAPDSSAPFERPYVKS